SPSVSTSRVPTMSPSAPAVREPKPRSVFGTPGVYPKPRHDAHAVRGGRATSVAGRRRWAPEPVGVSRGFRGATRLCRGAPNVGGLGGHFGAPHLPSGLDDALGAQR